MGTVLALVAATIGAHAGEPGSIVLIVNAEVPLQGSVRRAEVRRLFSGTRRHWPRGAGRVVLVMLPRDATPTRALFALLDTTALRWATGWQQRELAGRAVAPREVESLQSMIAHVAGTRGAIGYLGAEDVADLPSRVRVVEIENSTATPAR